MINRGMRLRLARGLGIVALVAGLAALVVQWMSNRSMEPAEPTSEPGPSVISSAPVSVMADTVPHSSADGVQGTLEDTMRPLAQAAQDHRIDPAEVVPTAVEIEAAVASGDLNSQQAAPAMDKLRAGYARFGMPFPRLPDQRAPRNDPNAPTPPSDDPTLALRSYFEPTIENLARVAREKGEDPTDVQPPESAIEAAVASGDFESKPARALLDTLRREYQARSIPFPEPGAIPDRSSELQVEVAPEPDLSLDEASAAGSPPPETQTATGQQRILEAYFQVMSARLESTAREQDLDPAALMPDAALVAEAVASGDVRSDASRAAITQLNKGYDAVGLAFSDPSASQ